MNTSRDTNEAVTAVGIEAVIEVGIETVTAVGIETVTAVGIEAVTAVGIYDLRLLQIKRCGRFCPRAVLALDSWPSITPNVYVTIEPGIV